MRPWSILSFTVTFPSWLAHCFRSGDRGRDELLASRPCDHVVVFQLGNLILAETEAAQDLPGVLALVAVRQRLSWRIREPDHGGVPPVPASEARMFSLDHHLIGLSLRILVK